MTELPLLESWVTGLFWVADCADSEQAVRPHGVVAGSGSLRACDCVPHSVAHKFLGIAPVMACHAMRLRLSRLQSARLEVLSVTQFGQQFPVSALPPWFNHWQ